MDRTYEVMGAIMTEALLLVSRLETYPSLHDEETGKDWVTICLADELAELKNVLGIKEECINGY